jgi:hypothetical protein
MKCFYFKNIGLALLFLTAYQLTTAQVTMTTTGNWNTATNWTASNIGDLITENVTINASVNPTIPGAYSTTVGNTTLTNNNTLTINSTGSLTLGASGNPKTLTTNMNTTVTVNGLLEIWGDFTANSNLTFNIGATGVVKIHGNWNLSSVNTNVTVASGGTITVDGSLNGGNNTNFNVNGPSGSVRILTNLTVAGGSNLNGSGHFYVAGTCNGGGSSFCSSSTLPITLIDFKAAIQPDQSVNLTWSTASELNFDFFEVERSTDGKNFISIGKLKGNGTSALQHDYFFVDEKAMAGKAYYRLKSVDLDGTFEYSKVAFIDLHKKKSFSVSPNPIEGNILKYTLNFTPETTTYLLIFNSQNDVVGTFFLTDYPQSISFSNELKSGIYFAKFVSEEFTLTERFIVAR